MPTCPNCGQQWVYDPLSAKQVNEQEERAWRLVKRWVPLLGLDNWNISIKVSQADLPDIAVVRNCAALADCEWAYRSIRIRVHGPFAAQATDERMEYHLLHEFCHGMVNEMRQFAESTWNDAMRHEERVVDHLADAFLRVRKADANA